MVSRKAVSLPPVEGNPKIYAAKTRLCFWNPTDTVACWGHWAWNWLSLLEKRLSRVREVGVRGRRQHWALRKSEPGREQTGCELHKWSKTFLKVYFCATSSQLCLWPILPRNLRFLLHKAFLQFLRLVVLSGVSSASQGTSAMSGDVSVVTTGERGCYWHLVVEARDAAKHKMAPTKDSYPPSLCQ